MVVGKPNIFRFAPRELSQDAFICWLLEWSDERYQYVDPALHSSGRALIDALLKLHNQEPMRRLNLVIYRQLHKVDVVIDINSQLILMIEDKVHSREHLAQLTYSDVIGKRFPKHKILPVYFKTGDQCDFSEVTKAGYKCFLRHDFLKVLKAGLDSGIANHTYIDFAEYLMGMESAVESFRTTKVFEWEKKDRRWIGFFKELQARIPALRWEEVNNPSGGFWAAHWAHMKWKGHDVYLQLEEDKLCFKIEATELGSNKSAIRNRWMRKILTAGDESGFVAITRPARLGIGSWMTVAQISAEHWLKTGPDGLLDIKRTMAELKMAQRLLGRAASL